MERGTDGWMDKRMGALTEGRMTEGIGACMDGQTGLFVIKYEGNQMF